MNSIKSDEDLIMDLKDGDMDALRILVDRHRNYAFTIANRIVQTRELAEEIAQDAFVKIYRSADKFKGESKFTTWFYRIVFNTAISAKRKHRIHTSPMDQDTISMAGMEKQDEMISNDRKQFIDLAMAELSDDDKLLVTLFYFEEMSLEEIGEITSIDKHNLKVKLFRARKKLAKRLNYILKDEAETLL